MLACEAMRKIARGRERLSNPEPCFSRPTGTISSTVGEILTTVLSSSANPSMHFWNGRIVHDENHMKRRPILPAADPWVLSLFRTEDRKITIGSLITELSRRSDCGRS